MYTEVIVAASDLPEGGGMGILIAGIILICIWCKK